MELVKKVTSTADKSQGDVLIEFLKQESKATNVIMSCDIGSENIVYPYVLYKPGLRIFH